VLFAVVQILRVPLAKLQPLDWTRISNVGGEHVVGSHWSYGSFEFDRLGRKTAIGSSTPPFSSVPTTVQQLFQRHFCLKDSVASKSFTKIFVMTSKVASLTVKEVRRRVIAMNDTPVVLLVVVVVGKVLSQYTSSVVSFCGSVFRQQGGSQDCFVVWEQPGWIV
jgi:hypothetical protein